MKKPEVSFAHRSRRSQLGVGLGTCPGCGKQCYPTRKAAKNAMKILHPEDRMSAYQCKSENPMMPQPVPWHIGHLPKEVKTTDVSRSDYFDRGIKESPSCGKKDSANLICGLPVKHNGRCLARSVAGEWLDMNINNRTETKKGPENGTDYLRKRSGHNE